MVAAKCLTMTLMDIAAGVLIGNLFAAAAAYGIHIATDRNRGSGQSSFGWTIAAIPTVLVYGSAVIGEPDEFATVNAAAFSAAAATIVFLWGMRTIIVHEKTNDFSVAAWAAVLAPVAVGLVWLWPYAPIG